MCGILAVLGCSDDSQGKRVRVLELSRRQLIFSLLFLILIKGERNPPYILISALERNPATFLFFLPLGGSNPLCRSNPFGPKGKPGKLSYSPSYSSTVSISKSLDANRGRRQTWLRLGFMFTPTLRIRKRNPH